MTFPRLKLSIVVFISLQCTIFVSQFTIPKMESYVLLFHLEEISNLIQKCIDKSFHKRIDMDNAYNSPLSFSITTLDAKQGSYLFT